MPDRRCATAILFDIDGTLLHTSGAGSRALSRAFAERYGWPDAMAGVRLGGWTDPRIFESVCASHGRPRGGDGRAEQVAFFALYERLLADELANGPEGELYPGVPRLLERLAATPDVLVGLLTGNVAAGARLKLDHFGVWDRFAFGAFGDEAPEREDLLPVALERASALAGRRLAPADAVVVGDTPRDVAVDLAHGARIVAVATGSYREDELRAAGAGHVLEDFSDLELALSALLGPGREPWR
jgi:phosphoglycolate phosphatase-like HAD superfamily hydrolase